MTGQGTNGEWAVVLGTSAGAGAAIARAVARDPGLDVFGVHRGHHAESAAAVSDDVRAAGRRIVMHVADAGNAEGACTGSDTVLAAAGLRRVRLLVHAVSGGALGRFVPPEGDALGPRQIERTFDRMAHSFVYWVQELRRRDLLAPGARLLGLTNLLHESHLENCAVIAAAKGALEMYVRALAIELGPLGFRVNLLKFGTLVTPALTRVLGPAGLRALEATHRQMTPAGRMLSADDLGRVVSYLAREESEWFNGATIDYSGGMTLSLLDVVAKSGGSAAPT